MYATGIGGLTALKLIRQHGSIENILENLSKERFFFFPILKFTVFQRIQFNTYQLRDESL
jgi:5'-3' exonuclease